MNEQARKPSVAEVRQHKGRPHLFVNGQDVLPVWYLPSSTAYTARQDVAEMKRAAAAGIRLLVIPYSTFDYDDRDAFVSRLRGDILSESSMAENPDAWLVLRVDCNFPPENIGLDESQRLVVNDGQKQRITSLTSEAWYEHVRQRLVKIVEHVKSDPLLNARVIGYELLGGDTGEWFGPGYWQGQMDVSEPNRDAFRRFLQQRYASDAALQQAWGTSAVRLDTAELPSWELVPGVRNRAAQRDFVQAGQSLLTAPENRSIVDYLDYTNRCRCDRLVGFAQAIKAACNHEKLVIIYYGYHVDCYTAGSNHFAMARLLESPHIDMLSGPVSYQDRCEGGIGAYMGMADAVTAAGKLWMDEGDYRSPVYQTEPNLPYPPTTQLLDQTIRREMGKCMIHSTGVWWLSFNQGWFDYPSFWEHNREMVGLMERYNAVKTADIPEVCYILDEEAMSLVGDADAIGMNLLRLSRTVLYRSGLRFGMYTVEDLLAGRLDEAKLYVFASPWRLSPEKARLAAERLHRSGKTTLYFYGSGDTAPEDFRLLTGLMLEPQSGLAGYAPRLSLADGVDPRLADATWKEQTDHGITQALADLAALELNPIYAVTPEEGVSALGRYADGPAAGEIGLATYQKDGWTSLFYGGMALSEALLSYAADVAGVHRFTPPGDVLDADSRLVMLHVSEAGPKTIQFPSECDIYLFDERRWLRGDSCCFPDTYRGQTVLVFYGDRRELEAIVEEM